MKPWLIPVVLALSAVALAAQAQGPGRRYLPDAVPDLVSNLVPIGNYPPTNHLRLAIGLPVQNQDELSELLRQVYDPGSTNFHRYLTPAEYTRRFGPSEQQYDAVRQFAEANGLVVVGTFSNRVVLDVEGRVSDVERAFQVTERVYQHPTDARTFFAPDRAPSVPANLPVLSVSGLDNYSLPAPKHVLRPAALTPQSGSGPSGTYAGGDFRAAYLPGVALNGSGQSVALLEFDGYYATDIASYESSFSLPSVPLVNIAVDGGVSSPGSGNSEVALDIEMAISMAPGLAQVLVYEAPNPSPWPDLLSRIANDNLAKQISCSWGGGSPDPTSEQLFQQMALQGQSFFNASGDSDAFTGSVPFPSDSTNITQVGGTTLATTGPGGAWSGETVWNWGQVKGKYVGSSGGVSTTYSIPAWQQGIDMTANLGSTTMRNIPDVALTADNIYVKYNNGSSGTFGGTSCAAPLWAAVTALINQQAAAAGQAPAGFLNPLVYSLGKSAVFTNNFRDITSGNNFSRSSPTNYPGVAGYDLCTGWGTPKGTNLINVLALKLYVAGQPANRTVPAGSNVTFSVTAGGLPPFGYRWQFNGANLANNTHVSGVNSNVLLLTAVTTNDSGSYQVIITNVAGAITSNPAQLTVATSANTNRPPVLSPIPDQTVYATGTLTLTNVATDPDGDALTFGFASAAPTDATINTANGVFSWSPTLAQSPSTNLISIQVTDNGVPSLSATQTFTIYVLATNFPPVLAPVANRSLHAGMTLIITNAATDADGDALTFSLTNSPAGAVIDGASGILSWTPALLLAGTTNGFTVVVTDNGIPPLSDRVAFSVVVYPPPTFSSAAPVSFSNGVLTIFWNAIPGQTYSVQTNGDLGNGNWSELPPEVTATNSTASKADILDPSSTRFYRVVPVQ